MKNFLFTLLMFVGFAFVSCSSVSESKPTYLEQNFTIDSEKNYELNETITGVPVQSQSLNDLIKDALILNNYSAESTDIVSFLQTDNCEISIDFSKTPKEYKLKTDGVEICEWRYINRLKKTPTGFLVRTLEFRSFD